MQRHGGNCPPLGRRRACLPLRRDFQGQGLGIIVWAFAKIGYDPSKIRDLLQAFAQEVRTQSTFIACLLAQP